MVSRSYDFELESRAKRAVFLELDAPDGSEGSALDLGTPPMKYHAPAEYSDGSPPAAQTPCSKAEALHAYGPLPGLLSPVATTSAPAASASSAVLSEPAR